VTNCGPDYPDVVVITKAEELFAGEVRSIVGDDGVQDSKAVDNVSE
jgi:hypothetical protein